MFLACRGWPDWSVGWGMERMTPLECGSNIRIESLSMLRSLGCVGTNRQTGQWSAINFIETRYSKATTTTSTTVDWATGNEWMNEDEMAIKKASKCLNPSHFFFSWARGAPANISAFELGHSSSRQIIIQVFTKLIVTSAQSISLAYSNWPELNCMSQPATRLERLELWSFNHQPKSSLIRL